MRRREFITLATSAAIAWPRAARAQQRALPVIGYLSIGTPRFDAVRLAAVRQGLAEIGHVEGRNVAGEYRWAEGRRDRLAAMALELVRRPADVIVAIGGAAPALAAKAVTTTIPIVFITSGDPVKLGLVASLNQPGNVTGVSNLVGVVVAKQLEMLREMIPRAALIGALVGNDPTMPFYTGDLQAAAGVLGLRLFVANAAAESDFETAFAELVQRRVDAIVVPSEALFNSVPAEIVALAARHRLPAVYAYSEFARIGGLMSYGGSFGEPFRQAGLYAGQILKGKKPTELPVIQSSKIEMIVNLKTAKTLGLEVPPTLLARADEVIE
jgi:putative tryptophan/tyrosine transport system substrate-binding protein